MPNNIDTQDFLVELGTEELPPKALSKLSRSFTSGIVQALAKHNLNHGEVKAFATPRRLAVSIKNLDQAQSDKTSERWGPATKAAFDENGAPTRAAVGFASSCGVELTELKKQDKDGTEKLFYSTTVAGKSTLSLLGPIVADALSKLPIPKRMRWGSSRDEFVRPVHWLLMLFGREVVDTTILGLKAGNKTRGHRFHFPQEITIDHVCDYESQLLDTGSVVACFETRKAMIHSLVMEQAEELNAVAVVDEDLLDEVTGLVEFPVALTGQFDSHFLSVPPEALIYAMKTHQKYFYVVDSQNELLPNFITVSNIQSSQPAEVVKGNERVIRPRLADAQFFFESDKATPLVEREEQLKKIVFQKELGTVFDKTQRVRRLATQISLELGFNDQLSDRAARLSKCDLLTDMVGEFADLQGRMGYYYARNDGEEAEVAEAIHEQYLPRFSGDVLPSSNTGLVLALADKLDSIVGMFAIGQPPTGSKDPFALRRSAIGILRILVENNLDLDLHKLLSFSLEGFPDIEFASDTEGKLFEFFLERFRAWYQDENISADVFQAVYALKPSKPLDFHQRILAVHSFSQLEQAGSLASANKRVANILEKESQEANGVGSIDEACFIEPEEGLLLRAIIENEQSVLPLFLERDYTRGLTELAEINQVVDDFFTAVLVMSEDDTIKSNRIALLHRLRALFLRVADISLLHKS